MNSTKEISSIKYLSSEERESQSEDFGEWIDSLLSLQGEKSAKGLEAVLKVVKESEFTLEKLKEAFILYVKGKLPIDPKDNYLTVILFSKVMNLYTQETNKINKHLVHKSSAKRLTAEDFKRILIEEYHNVKKSGRINFMRLYLYDYLKGKKLILNDKKIYKIIEKVARENIFKRNEAKNKTAINRSEHIANKLNCEILDQEVIVEIKKISLERFFNQFATKEQLLNKIK